MIRYEPHNSIPVLDFYPFTKISCPWTLDYRMSLEKQAKRLEIETLTFPLGDLVSLTLTQPRRRGSGWSDSLAASVVLTLVSLSTTRDLKSYDIIPRFNSTGILYMSYRIVVCCRM